MANVIKKDDIIIGFPSDLTKYALEQIKYLTDGDAESMVCTIIDFASVLKELLDYDCDKLVAIKEYCDGTLYCEHYGEGKE